MSPRALASRRTGAPLLTALAAFALAPASPATAAAGPAAPAAPVDAAPLRPASAILEDYVAQALQSNLALQGQRHEVERALEALAAARARYLPEISLQSRYTRADGGRTLDFPIGSLLNPAYQTLNELLAAQGQPPRFSQLPDVTIPFQREREQDSRVSLRQPLYQPAVPAAVRAQRALLEGEQAASRQLARELRRDVTLAYLEWLRALRARAVLEATRAVLEENLRVNQSLLRNGRITEDQVLRADSERLALLQQLREAEGAITQGRNAVNFLLNRPLPTPLEDARDPGDAGDAAAGAGAAVGAGATPDRSQSRPEFTRADALAAAAAAQQQVARAALRPSLALGVDAGTQGASFQFGPGYNYSAASLVFSWKFFDGGANRAEAARAGLALRQARLQQQALAQQIGLERQQAEDRLAVARDSLAVAAARAAAAQAALRIAARKRDAGAVSQVEFLDAQREATGAELALVATRYALMQRETELHYAAGLLPEDAASDTDGALPP